MIIIIQELQDLIIVILPIFDYWYLYASNLLLMLKF